MSVQQLFLEASAMKLKQSAEKISICLDKLTDRQIWARDHENENAIGNLILHLAGNARQWIVSGLGGQPDIRERDHEFSAGGGMGRQELAFLVGDTIAAVNTVLAELTTERLTQIYTIQGRRPSGVEAVLNVVEHFGQHTGQIIFATKSLTGEDLGLAMPKVRTA